MAISGTLAKLLRTVQLPRGGTLLEIGEANWYGDAAPDFTCRDGENLFAVAKDFYADLFAPSHVVFIDGNGTDDALRYDLNHPLPEGSLYRATGDYGEAFDVVINHGTAEHIFNIAQVFATMHDRCELNGLL